jgi:hypothetical protein
MAGVKVVKLQDNDVVWPNGTKTSIHWIDPITGDKHKVELAVGPAGTFFALFPQDDVDFEVHVDNSDSEREIRWNMAVNGQTKKKKQKDRPVVSVIKTLISNGPNFHFNSQHTLKGQALVGKIAAHLGISWEKASETAGNIVFKPEIGGQILKKGMLAESIRKVLVCVVPFNGEAFDVRISSRWTARTKVEKKGDRTKNRYSSASAATGI